MLIDWYVILGMAKFWASRVTYNKARTAYEINGVIPPDEYAVNVSNSGTFVDSPQRYTNFRSQNFFH
jgi:trehalose/maltose hydrolase-like predicted phosphorylase